MIECMTAAQYKKQLQKQRRSKYHNVPVVIDGIRFASKREGRYYADLKRLERARLVKNIELQPRFDFTIGGVKMFTYVADFAFDEGGKRIVADTKGVETNTFRIKKKIIEAVYGITIRVVK